MDTPIELEKIRQKELASIQKQMAQAGEKTVDADIIESATPDDQKPKGASKLPSLLFTLGSQIPQIIQPSLQNLIQKYIPDPDTCPNEIILNELIAQRNNIVQSVNNIGTKIDQLGTSITGTSNFLNTILAIITAVDTAAIIASAAAKLLPVTPGVVPAALNDAQTFIRKITFDKQGNSKLSKLSGAISSSALVISVLSVYILRVKNLLDVVDIYINKCQENPNIILTSNAINSLANSQRQAQKTQNQIGYKGFIIEIEEVPYTPTVNRRRAIGRNADGIIAVQTELSFTTNNQTLINELKLIIDQNNIYENPTPPVFNAYEEDSQVPLTATQTQTQSELPTTNPDPLGYLGKTVGEEGVIVLGNGQAEDIYKWDGSKWNYIETININDQ